MTRLYTYVCDYCGHRHQVRGRDAKLTCPHPGRPRQTPDLMRLEDDDGEGEST